MTIIFGIAFWLLGGLTWGRAYTCSIEWRRLSKTAVEPAYWLVASLFFFVLGYLALIH